MKPVIRYETVGGAEAAGRVRIAHLSDFHLWFSPRKLADIEEIVARWQPDVLALTGDYADTPRGQCLMIDWIARMAALYPLCWIAGNHDRWFGARFLRGLTALEHAFAIDERDAWITTRGGTCCRFSTLARFCATPSVRDDPVNVVLLHNPGEIQAAQLRNATRCILLAGHLHGGQITLWRDRSNRPQPASSCFAWLADRWEIGASTLIVSRGLGDTLPLRYGAAKEVVIIDYATLPPDAIGGSRGWPDERGQRASPGQ